MSRHSIDAPLTTPAPCINVYSNCAYLAKYWCYNTRIATNCQKAPATLNISRAILAELHLGVYICSFFKQMT